MSSIDLEFSQSVATNGDLVFGDSGSSTAPSRTAAFNATLPAPTLAGTIGERVHADVAATLPGPTLSGTVAYDNRLTRYMQRATTGSHQAAIEYRPTLEGSWSLSDNKRIRPSHVWQTAQRAEQDRASGFSTTQRARFSNEAPHQAATHVGGQSSGRSQTAYVMRRSASALHNTALHTSAQSSARMQTAVPYERRATTGWQIADRVFKSRVSQSGASTFRIGVGASVGRWQVALKVQAGAHPAIIVPPVGHICYTPGGDLVFQAEQTDSSALLFICDNEPAPPTGQIVVPVKEVYTVANNIYLKRASDNAQIKCESASLALDVASWTWSFNGSLPATELDLVRPDDGPVEVKLGVNGSEILLLIESVSRDRTFGAASIKVSGRGINAQLDAPYAATQSFGEYAQMTAQQLMAEVLTLNGVSLGWDLTWNIDDWLVPANVFNHQGTYISAINSIAAAAGAYIQPAKNTQTFIINHLYPTAPWEWGATTADIVLPSDVVVQEGLNWVKKPDYNRVYVSGEGSGILGQVARAGSAGDILAPMVTDRLIVATAAARQRGRAILSDTGKQVRASLGLPVLDETGLIMPGTFIQYEDGATVRKGIVRSLNVSMRMPEVWQSIEVETHV